MLAVRLDKDTEKRLDRLAKETHRSKSHYVREAVAQYLAEKEDILLAMARLEKGGEGVTTGEMWRSLGWEEPDEAGSGPSAEAESVPPRKSGRP